MKLHTRDDEQPEEQWPLIDWSIWHYPGCHFCGWEDHRQRDCPNRPGYTAKHEGQGSRNEPHRPARRDPALAAPGHVEAATQARRVEISALTAGV